MRRYLVPLLALLLVGAVMGPVLGRLGSHLLGIEYVDHYGTQWFYWFVGHQLGAGEGLGWTDLFFFPWGKDVLGHTGANVLDGLLAWPFSALLGHVLGYNLFLLTMVGATGWAAWRLARDLSDDAVAAGTAAVFVALSPFVLTEVLEGRPTQAILLFPVLFVRGLWRAGREAGWKAPVLAGVFLALSGYQYWYYGFFGGLMVLAGGLAQARRGGAVLLRFALVAGVGGVLVAPVAVPLVLRSASAGGVPGLLDVSRWTLTHAPPVAVEGFRVGLHLWQPLRLRSGFFMLTDDGVEVFLEHAVIAPALLLPLLGAALVWPGRLSRWALAAMVAALLVLAVGPFLLVGHLALPDPLYILLVRGLGFLQRLWFPSRAVAFLTILGGCAVAVLLDRLAGRPRLQAALAVGILAASTVDLVRGGALPMSAWDAAVPAGYRCLADGDGGAIIELPVDWNQAHLYYQTVHERPIMGGMLETNAAFIPPELPRLRQHNRLVGGLMAAGALQQERPIGFSRREAQELYDLGYRYVVVQRDAYVSGSILPGGKGIVGPQLVARMDAQLREALGNPAWSDARVDIYPLWGAPAPCRPEDVPADRAVVGRTEVEPQRRLVGGGEVGGAAIRRLF